ncbi:MAG: helix-turn-helix transcriptional regulator [Pseudonocardia sp.]|nr:helix-turn-helix transcriptional regulator [Pseudonocardia sp.]MBO0873304.1 helix-turn-helix transcriptional regulator [Pseudonocardia sp.]
MATTTHPSEMDSTVCSIARTMRLIGQPWTMLVLRDLFNGMRRFDELAEHLGIARNVLTRRLATLVDAGLVTRQAYREPGQRARQEYRLTQAGRDLRPVLIAVMAYGDEHLAGTDGPPVRLEHAGCGAEVAVRLECAHGHNIEPADRLRVRPGPGAKMRLRRP